MYKRTFPGSIKDIHLVLQPAEFNENFTGSNFSNDLFFVHVVCKGIVGECTPCRLDEMTSLGVTCDYGVLYQKAMGYTREIADNCNIPQNFIDFILNFNAFKYAVETEHYIPAIQYYNQLMGFSGSGSVFSSNTINRRCGCNG